MSSIWPGRDVIHLQRPANQCGLYRDHVGAMRAQLLVHLLLPSNGLACRLQELENVCETHISSSRCVQIEDIYLEKVGFTRQSPTQATCKTFWDSFQCAAF
jgi:hypothetical protein